MRVAADDAPVGSLEALGADDDDVLAELRDQLDPLLLEALDCGRAVGLNRSQDSLRERLELVVLRDGLRLTADSGYRACAPVQNEPDEAFRRGASRSLARRGHPALAQEESCTLEVAARLL